MSTRSLICVENNDGSVTSIYCHHDGYLSHVGKILVENYTNHDVINKLMDLGDLDSLGTEPIDNPNAWKDCFSFEVFRKGLDMFEYYKQMHPENMCDTYKSRGEDCPADKLSFKETMDAYKDSWCEYMYLYMNNNWYYIQNKNSKKKDFKLVKDKLKEKGEL